MISRALPLPLPVPLPLPLPLLLALTGCSSGTEPRDAPATVLVAPAPGDLRAMEEARLTVARAASLGPVEVQGDVSGVLTRWADVAPDPLWTRHPRADVLIGVQAFDEVGPHGFFALRRYWSDFDHEDALRPYVFRVEDGTIHDLWRGTSLARPLAAAAVIRVGDRERLCVIHRDDSFLRPDPSTTGRIRKVYRWTGFGFRTVDEPDADAVCATM